MQIVIAIGALPYYPVATALSVARSAGADGAELLLTADLLRRGPDDYARAADERDLPILSVHSLIRWRAVSLDRKLIDDRQAIAFAAALPNCETVVLHPPLTGSRQSPMLNRWLNAITEARDHSANPDVILAVENRGEYHDGTEAQFLDDLERLRRLAGEWDLGITLDIAHAASHGLSLIEAVDAVAPRLANVHLSDAVESTKSGGLRNGLWRDHQLPGRGVLPLSRVLAELAAEGYDGPLTLELSPMALRAYWPWKARALLRSAVDDLRVMLSTIPSATRAREQPRHPAV